MAPGAAPRRSARQTPTAASSSELLISGAAPNWFYYVVAFAILLGLVRHGREFLVPLVVAALLFTLASAITERIGSARIGGWRPPKWFARTRGPRVGVDRFSAHRDGRIGPSRSDCPGGAPLRREVSNSRSARHESAGRRDRFRSRAGGRRHQRRRLAVRRDSILQRRPRRSFPGLAVRRLHGCGARGVPQETSTAVLRRS